MSAMQSAIANLEFGMVVPLFVCCLFLYRFQSLLLLPLPLQHLLARPCVNIGIEFEL